MTRTNFYVLIDRTTNKVLSHPVKLSENWQNIHGMSSLSDEEISDLEWAGHPGLGWIKFNSEFPFDLEIHEDWFEFAKNSIKNEYANQRWEAEKKGIVYKNILIDTDDRTKTAILLKTQLAVASPGKTFSWKYNNSTVEFTSSDIINIADALSDYIQKCFDKEAELIDLVNQSETEPDLSDFTLSVNWPSNNYNS